MTVQGITLSWGSGDFSKGENSKKRAPLLFDETAVKGSAGVMYTY